MRRGRRSQPWATADSRRSPSGIRTRVNGDSTGFVASGCKAGPHIELIPRRFLGGDCVFGAAAAEVQTQPPLHEVDCDGKGSSLDEL
jgi:hypothetical protein